MAPPDGISWNELRFGRGPRTLVLVHGWCCRAAQFEILSRSLEDDFSLVCPDLPGHGDTPLGAFRPGFTAYADALAGWIAGKNLRHPILVGHSMGGVLSLMVARRCAARAVINLDGSLPARVATTAAQVRMREWLDEPDGRTKLAAAIRENFFLPGERSALADRIVSEMTAAPESVLRFLPREAPGLNPAEILSGLPARVLFLGADPPRFDERALQTLLPDAHVATIRNHGHFLHLFAPDQVADAVRRFVREMEADA